MQPRLLLPLVGIFAFAWLFGCQGSLRGGLRAQPSTMPKGRLMASFVRAQCSDRSDAYQKVFVDYVQGDDGTPFVVERSVSAEWLVFNNGFLDGSEIVFQLIRSEDNVLLEYRFPWDARTPGRFSLSRQFAEQTESKHKFRARGIHPQLTCQVLRVDPSSGTPLSEKAAQALPEQRLPSPSIYGTQGGYDGHSFAVGDRVLIDIEGQAMPAVVLQAPGDSYYVHYDNAPDGSGEWIKPYQVTGRFK